MINTLLEQVPIKMEVKDVHETANNPANDEVAMDDDKINETDEEVDDDDDDDDEEEESDIESDALEIEQEATMLISSDEEAELEAQRIRFPNIAVTKKMCKDSNNSSRSSSRSSQCSNTSSKNITYEIVTKKSTIEETENKQRITLLLKNTQVNKSPEICNVKNDNNTQTTLKGKTEKKKNEKTNLENNKNKKDEIAKHLDNNKPPAAADIHINTEKLIKSPVNDPAQKDRRGSNNSACSVASTVGSESAETECCGNIYVFNLQHKLIFNCQYCDLKYGDLENFGRHLHEAHRLFNLDEGSEKENAHRNLPKTNRITNNPPKSSDNVKKEPLQSFELAAEPPVVLPPAVLADPLNSCGNVFMLNHRKLFLVCGYCECKYANVDLFEKHLRQQHRIFEGCRNELNVIPKVEIKEETCVVNEVGDRPADAIITTPSEITLNTTTENDTEMTIAPLAEIEVAALEKRVEEEKKKCNDSNKDRAEPSSLLTQESNSESVVNKDLETTTDVNALPDTNENEKVVVENKEISSPMELESSILLSKDVESNEVSAPKLIKNNEISSAKESKNKRCPSTPLITMPPKSPKRNTQNNAKHDIRENTTANMEDKLSDKVEKNAQITETKEITEISKSKDTEETVKPPTSNSKESIIPQATDAIEPIKSKQMSESDTKVPSKLLERRKNSKSTKEVRTGNRRPKRDECKKRTPEKYVESKTQTSKEAIVTKPSVNTIKSSQTKEVKQEKVDIESNTVESQDISDTESKYKCSMCPKVLAHKNSLKIHERIHTGEKPYECEVCHKHFRNRGNLSLHQKGHHTDEAPKKIYKCEICEKTFLHSSHFKKHIFSHSMPKRFKCGICLRGYSSKDALKLHIDEDHKPGEKLAKSKRRSAGKQILPSTKVEVDTLPELSTSSPSFIEATSETVLTQQKNLNDINDLNDLNEDPVNDIIEQLQNEMANNELETGELNAVTFTINAVVPDTEETKKPIVTTPTVYDTQLIEIDSTVSGQHQLLKVVKRFFCNECHSTFDKRTRLIEHKRVHTGEKPFTCDECGKQFRIRIRLKEHKLRHSKEKKFICEICKLGCCTKQDLNQHMRHHNNDRRYQCTMCPKAFVRSSDLKIHIRVHTGEKPYICEICHKCFRANQNLCGHKKSHMGDASKIYKCEHCEKKFMRNIDRKVHMRSHTGEKPYKCEICGRGYSSKFNVRVHIERDHIAADDTVPKGKRKPGPKPKALKEELEKQKKLIEELRNQLWHQLKRDEKIIPSDEEMLTEQTLLEDSMATDNSPLSTTSNNNDPIKSAYELLNKLKSSTNISKPLTAVPSPPPMAEPPSNPFTNAKKLSTTLLPLTITQKVEQASPTLTPTPAPSPSPSSSTSCPTTSPPKTTATKVVSQKTSLGIQQVSVTVSMQVENVTATPTTSVEKENASLITGSPSGASSPKKERKITSYFTVVGQKAEV